MCAKTGERSIKKSVKNNGKRKIKNCAVVTCYGFRGVTFTVCW